MAFSGPDPCDESELASQLLRALENGETEVARRLQGEIFGLHFAKLRAYVAGRLEGQPRVHVEEVFGEAAAKMFAQLRRPEKVRWVTAGRSFAPLFFKIAKFETINYWQSGDLDTSRAVYRNDRLSSPGLDAALQPAQAGEDPYARLAEIEAASSDAVKVMEAARRVGGLDELLITLIDLEGVRLKDVERLLVLAQWDDADAAVAEARSLASVAAERAEDYLTLVSECPPAHPMSYNSLKVAVHRARKRVRNRLERDDLDSL